MTHVVREAYFVKRPKPREAWCVSREALHLKADAHEATVYTKDTSRGALHGLCTSRFTIDERRKLR